jgi:hypothetical protein
MDVSNCDGCRLLDISGRLRSAWAGIVLGSSIEEDDPMGTIKVSIDAETDGKSGKFEFEWAGEDDDIENVMAFVTARADEAG